jgi:phosphonoacetaldehyde hydrolase
MNNSSDGLQAVVFDWAGTTVDYGCLAPVEAFTEAFLSRGIVVGEADVRAHMGRAKRDHLALLFALPAVIGQWSARYGREPTAGDIDNLYYDVERLLDTAALRHADPLLDVVEVVEELRRRGLAIGSCTGYPRQLMAALAPLAAERGYAPDVLVTPDDVPQGRPAPYMCYLNAIRLQTYPLEKMAKVGDTVVDVLEGRAAGMWTIATLLGGSELGLSPQAVAASGEAELETRLAAARARLLAAGAHYMLRSISEAPDVVKEIDRRLQCGEHPPSVRRTVDLRGAVSFAGTNYRLDKRYAYQQVEVRLVGERVEMWQAGRLLRTQPARHDRSKEHGAFATPGGRPHKRKRGLDVDAAAVTEVLKPICNARAET